MGLGLLGILVGLGYDRALGRPTEVGRDQLAGMVLGAILIALGALLQTGRGSRWAANLLVRTTDRSEVFLRQVAHRPGLYIRLGIWFGLLAGAAEVLLEVARSPYGFWPHLFWLAPLTYAVLYGLIGLAIAVAAWRSRQRRAHLVLALAAFLTLAGASWLFLLFPQVHVVASTVLAVGIALQFARLLVAQAWAVGAVFRRTEWIVPSGVLVVAILAVGSTRNDEHDAVARRLLPASGEARNVVLIVLDTVRAKSMRFLGYERPTTPELDVRTQAGVVFETALSTAPWTLPSHSGMFTARWAHELDANWTTPLGDEYPTLAEVLSEHGYRTGGFVANLAYTSRANGLARGFSHYEDFQVGVWQAILTTSLGRKIVTGDWIRNTIGYHELVDRRPAAEINEAFLDWLVSSGEGPFFAFLNYFDAHEPYMPPEPFRDWFTDRADERRGLYSHSLHQADLLNWWALAPEEVSRERALYDGAIGSIDHEIGALLDEMGRRGVLDNTVVIVTSDHGEHFGEHGLYMHGNSLYLPQINVPLWILAPDVPATRVSAPVSLRDLPNTALDLARVSEVDGRSPFPGSSLRRFFEPGARQTPDTMLFSLTGGFGPPATPMAAGDMFSVVADPYQYIVNGDGSEELYDIRDDRGQLRDLIATPEAAGHLARLRAVRTERIEPIRDAPERAGATRGPAGSDRRREARRPRPLRPGRPS